MRGHGPQQFAGRAVPARAIPGHVEWAATLGNLLAPVGFVLGRLERAHPLVQTVHEYCPDLGFGSLET